MAKGKNNVEKEIEKVAIDIKEAERVVTEEKIAREKQFQAELESLQKKHGCTLSIQVALDYNGDVIKVNKRLVVTAGPKP